MKRNHKAQSEERSEFIERVLEINRVARVVKGGKRIRFRALVVIGDEKGRISYGLGKSADVSGAIAKAVLAAKKDLINIFIKGTTIPYPVRTHYKSAAVLLKPAPVGTGVVAGSSMRVVLELAGIKDVVGKALGSKNKLSNTMATIKALSMLHDPKELIRRRGTIKASRGAQSKATK
ncbi:TPA: 30S ribosomal protein S5 [Patescibacteria group bacterium]|nr:30S ribosomal protein S5 [Patescibacteria group bacterium]